MSQLRFIMKLIQDIEQKHFGLHVIFSVHSDYVKIMFVLWKYTQSFAYTFVDLDNQCPGFFELAIKDKAEEFMMNFWRLKDE